MADSIRKYVAGSLESQESMYPSAYTVNLLSAFSDPATYRKIGRRLLLAESFLQKRPPVGITQHGVRIDKAVLVPRHVLLESGAVLLIQAAAATL